MPVVRGCTFPDDLFYDVEHHVWYADAGNGQMRAGITLVGVALAREVLVFTPKRPGSTFEKDRAFATIESAKWVGSVRSAFDGTVVSVNDEARKNPLLVNEDCYGKGWMLVVQPSDDNWRSALIPGAQVAGHYENWMEGAAFPGCGVE